MPAPVHPTDPLKAWARGQRVALVKRRMLCKGLNNKGFYLTFSGLVWIHVASVCLIVAAGRVPEYLRSLLPNLMEN
jgi:hypothetical protein